MGVSKHIHTHTHTHTHIYIYIWMQLQADATLIDGDLVVLADNQDVAHALQQSKTLRVVIYSEHYHSASLILVICILFHFIPPPYISLTFESFFLNYYSLAVSSPISP